jgi:hypothetical protein
VLVGCNLIICPGIHYHNLVLPIGSQHHAGSIDLTSTEHHALLLIEERWLLVAEPFSEKRNPAIKTVGGFHILSFVLLEDCSVFLFKKYVFVLLSVNLALFFKILYVFGLLFVNSVYKFIDRQHPLGSLPAIS